MVQRKKLEDDEMVYYYWSIQFLTEFVRHSEKYDEQRKLEMIKETFCMEIFHSIEGFIQRCYEMIKVEKKQNKLWSKRMHAALKCYKENLTLIFLIEKKIKDFEAKASQEQNTQRLSQIDMNSKSNDGDEFLIDLDDFSKPIRKLNDPKQTLNQGSLDSNIQENLNTEKKSCLLEEKFVLLITKLKDQLFYIQEFRELFISMLREFDPTKMSKNFLRDLIEANHIFILMLENQKKNGSLSVGIKKKKAKKSSKKTQKKKETKEEKGQRKKDEKDYKKRLGEQDPELKAKLWDQMFIKIASLIQNKEELKIENDNLMPFDFVATSDQEFDSHKDLVIEKIQHLLIEKKPDDSIALFREARCLWPNEKQLFGSMDIHAEDEFEVYKDLFMKQLEIKKSESNLFFLKSRLVTENEVKISKKLSRPRLSV
jgi:hypothetical protein